MVADVRGSMMQPVSGKPTRNFKAGQVMAERMRGEQRCPHSMEELERWCEDEGLRKGGLEGLKALRYWPDCTQICHSCSRCFHGESFIHIVAIAETYSSRMWLFR